MVFGEEFFVTKGVEALINWFGKRKEDKQITHDILLSLKIHLENIIVDMNLSMIDGRIYHKKLRPLLPNDIKNLNQFLIKYKTKLDNELYNAVNEFINYLVEYNGHLNFPVQGNGDILYKYENTIKTSIDKYITQIDTLIKELE